MSEKWWKRATNHKCIQFPVITEHEKQQSFRLEKLEPENPFWHKQIIDYTKANSLYVKTYMAINLIVILILIKC